MPSVNGFSRQTSGRYKSQIIPVNNIIGLDKYYRSAHLLLRQVLDLQFQNLFVTSAEIAIGPHSPGCTEANLPCPGG